MRPLARTLPAAAMAFGLALGACAADGDAGGFAAAAANEQLPDPEQVKLNQGRIIATTECASCHAIGPMGPSPREDAPPLRTVLAQYNTASLEMDLMEGMRVGHADMPRFTFDPRTVDALIVYLESIQNWAGAEVQTEGRAEQGRL